MNPPRYPRGKRGIALLVTLSVLVLLTILTVLILSLIRFEVSSAHSRLETQRTRMFATMAVNDVVAKLRDNIPVETLAGAKAGLNLQVNCAWAAAPGRLVVPIQSTPGSTFRTVNLYSEGVNTGTVDLNAPLLGESSQHPIIPVNNEYPTSASMPVAWINVLQDGTRSIDGHSPTASNPIVGRYAYWVDTETSKVNLNTAGNANYNGQGQQEPYSLTCIDGLPSVDLTGDLQNLSGDPSRVDLSQLDAYAGAITGAQSLATYNHTISSFWNDTWVTSFNNSPANAPVSAPYRTTGMGRFNVIADWMNTPAMPTPITTQQIDANKFYLTTRAWTPDLTPWGLNKLWWQANGPQGTPNSGFSTFSLETGNRLNAPGAPDYPGSYSFITLMAGPQQPLKYIGSEPDFRYYVYPQSFGNSALAALSAPSSNLQTMGVSGNTNTTPSSFINNMMIQLARKDWPGFSGMSFVDKYGQYECEDLAYNLLYLFACSAGSGGYVPNQLFNASYTTPTYPAPPSGTGRDFYGLTYGAALFKYIAPGTSGTTGSTATVANPGGRIMGAIGAYPYINKVEIQFSGTSAGSGLPVGQIKSSNTGTSLNSFAGFCPTLSGNDTTKYFNIAMTPLLGITYPQSVAYANVINRSNFITIELSDIEVSATGTYKGASITYGGSNYIWGYPDDKSTANGIAHQSFPPLTPSSTENVLSLATGGTSYIGPFDIGSSPTITIKFRVVTTGRPYGGGIYCPMQTIPLGYDYLDTPDGFLSDGVTKDPQGSTKLTFTYSANYTTGIALPFPDPADQTLETSDPRDYRYVSDWTSYPSDTVGSPAQAPASMLDPLTSITGDSSKFAWPNTQGPTDLITAWQDNASIQPNDMRFAQNAGNIVSFPGIGWLSVLPLNCESSQPNPRSNGSSTTGAPNPTIPNPSNFNNGTTPIPWRTLSLEPSQKSGLLPDWLLLEAFGLAYNSTYLSQTQGKININADLAPFNLTRLTPLKCLLIPGYSSLIPSSPPPAITYGNNAAAIAADLASYKYCNSTYTALPSGIFLYPSQICEEPLMKGSGTTQFQREALARDIVGIATTQCSDFKVHVVAQSLAKNTTDISQAGSVTSEQRLEAVVSRTVNVGPDGIPGTSDDPQALTQTGGTVALTTLTNKGNDPALLGLAGSPSFHYKITQFNFMTY